MFFLLAVTLVGLLHFYLWLRLVADPALSGPPSLIATALIAGLFAAIVANFLRRKPLPRSFKLPVYVWMGLAFIASVLMGLADLGLSIASALPQVRLPPPIELARLQALGTLCAAAALTVWGVGSALGNPRIRRLEIALPGLTGEADGLRIVQLSDLHIGPTLRERWLKKLVDRVNGLEADLVVITGDLVDGAVAHVGRFVAPLADLKAKHGTFFCTGNHDYYSGADAWCAELERLGLRPLRNQAVDIAGLIELAGVDDRAGRFFGGGPDFAAALRRKSERPIVLLAHQPQLVAEAAKHRVALQLSGHTHGGQIWPMHHLVRLQTRYRAGLYRVGETALFVTRGVGFWGPPLRLLARAEIAVITLRARS